MKRTPANKILAQLAADRAPIDVLAVMDNAADSLSLSVNPRDGFDLREARAAVAELVEAAGRMADAADAHERMTARASLRAALAKFGGAS